MQHPDSHSTPRKVKPLKTKDEFSSLHRRIKPIKPPLGDLQRSSKPNGTFAKPQIAGSNKVISTINDRPRKQHKHDKKTVNNETQSAQQSLPTTVFSCRVNKMERIPLKLNANLITVGVYKESLRGLSLSYGIMGDRMWYRYTMLKNGDSLAQFDVRSEDHVPLKNECSSLGIKLVQAGRNVPPIAHKINSQERAPSYATIRSEEFIIKLMDSPATSDPETMLNSQWSWVDVTINERGIHLTSTPLKLFRWHETEFEKLALKHPIENSTIMKLVSPKVSAVIDVYSSQNMQKLEADIKRYKYSEKSAEKSPKTELKQPDEVVNMSGKLPKTTSRDARTETKVSSIFEELKPANFYSPQGKNGSTRPASSSSPKSFRNDGLFSSPVRSVASIQRLSVSPRPLAQKAETSKGEEESGTVETTVQPEGQQGKQPEGQPDGQSAEISLDLTESQPESHTEKRIPLKSPGRAPRRNRGGVTPVDDDDDIETLVEPTSEDFALLRSDGFKRILYKFWDGRSMHVGIEDIARLNPKIYINDTIIWFFLKMYMEKLATTQPELSQQILMLDTFFYFSMRSGDTPPLWVSRMPLTKKHVIVMPIHERAHWSVAVVVGLDKLFSDADGAEVSGPKYKPTIVILDSLGPTQIHHTVRKVVSVLANSLKMQDKPLIGMQDIRQMRAAIPTQTNQTDCGVFLLHYIEQIMLDPQTFLSKVASTEGRVLDMGSEYWKPSELWSKRSDMKNKLKELGNVDDDTETKKTNRAPSIVESGTGPEGAGANSDKPAGKHNIGNDNDAPRNGDSQEPSNGNGNGSSDNKDDGGNSSILANSKPDNADANDNRDAEDEDDDSIEVIGMEKINRKKRRAESRPEALFPSKSESRPRSPSTDVFMSPKREGSKYVDLS